MNAESLNKRRDRIHKRTVSLLCPSTLLSIGNGDPYVMTGLGVMASEKVVVDMMGLEVAESSRLQSTIWLGND